MKSSIAANSFFFSMVLFLSSNATSLAASLGEYQNEMKNVILSYLHDFQTYETKKYGHIPFVEAQQEAQKISTQTLETIIKRNAIYVDTVLKDPRVIDQIFNRVFKQFRLNLSSDEMLRKMFLLALQRQKLTRSGIILITSVGVNGKRVVSGDVPLDAEEIASSITRNLFRVGQPLFETILKLEMEHLHASVKTIFDIIPYLNEQVAVSEGGVSVLDQESNHYIEEELNKIFHDEFLLPETYLSILKKELDTEASPQTLVWFLHQRFEKLKGEQSRLLLSTIEKIYTFFSEPSNTDQAIYFLKQNDLPESFFVNPKTQKLYPPLLGLMLIDFKNIESEDDFKNSLFQKWAPHLVDSEELNEAIVSSLSKKSQAGKLYFLNDLNSMKIDFLALDTLNRFFINHEFEEGALRFYLRPLAAMILSDAYASYLLEKNDPAVIRFKESAGTLFTVESKVDQTLALQSKAVVERLEYLNKPFLTRAWVGLCGKIFSKK